MATVIYTIDQARLDLAQEMAQEYASLGSVDPSELPARLMALEKSLTEKAKARLEAIKRQEEADKAAKTSAEKAFSEGFARAFDSLWHKSTVMQQSLLDIANADDAISRLTWGVQVVRNEVNEAGEPMPLRLGTPYVSLASKGNQVLPPRTSATASGEPSNGRGRGSPLVVDGTEYPSAFKALETLMPDRAFRDGKRVQVSRDAIKDMLRKQYRVSE